MSKLLSRRNFLHSLGSALAAPELISAGSPGNDAVNQVVIIAGPGFLTFNTKTVTTMAQAFRQNGSNVLVAGNAENPITVNQIHDVMAHTKDAPTTVIVMAHGGTDMGEGILLVGREKGGFLEEMFFPPSATQKTSAILEAIVTSSNKRKLDMIMINCDAGAAFDHLESLPRGSTMATLSPRDMPLSGTDIDGIPEAISKSNRKKLAGFEIVDAYLMNSLHSATPAVIGIAGKEACDLQNELFAQFEKPFTTGQKLAIHNSLDQISSPERVEQIMTLITTPAGLHANEARDYGPALAAMKAAYPDCTKAPNHQAAQPDLMDIAEARLSSLVDRATNRVFGFAGSLLH